METFLPDSVKAILLALVAIVFVLSRLSRHFPHVAWLRAFRLPERHVTEEEKARRRRAGNRQAGLEIIVAGLSLPLLYLVATVMMFRGFETRWTVLVGVVSASCIALGIWILVRNR